MSLNLGLESLGFATTDISLEDLLAEQVDVLQDINSADRAFYDFANTVKDVKNFNEIVSSLQNHASEECIAFAQDLVPGISVEAAAVKIPGEKQSKVGGFFNKAWTKIKEWVKKAYNWLKSQVNKVLRKLDLVEQTAANPVVKVNYSPKEIKSLVESHQKGKATVDALLQKTYSVTVKSGSGKKTRKFDASATKDGYTETKAVGGYKVPTGTQVNDPAPYYEKLLKISILSRKPKAKEINIGDKTKTDKNGNTSVTKKDEIPEYIQNISKLMGFFYELSRAIPDAGADTLSGYSPKALSYIRAFAFRIQTFSGYVLSDFTKIMKVATGNAAAIAGRFGAAKQKEEDIKEDMKNEQKALKKGFGK